MRSPTGIYLFLFAIVYAAPAVAQAPAAPPPPWSGSLSAGIAVTGGNTDTTSTNFAFEVQSDKTKRNVFKADGLNIRSSRDGDAIVDRTSLSARDEYGILPRAFVFGQVQYLRDAFKNIDYLIAPTFGLGYRVIVTEPTALSVDLAAGSVTEKNPLADARTTGALTFGEKLTHRLSAVATVTQSLAALWKASEFGDALYTFQAGVAASVTTRVQIKVEFLDTYKTRPPTPLVQKNDTALITSFGFKF